MEEGEKKGGGDEKVSYWKLFTFADGLDVMLMVVGSLGAAVNGMALPLMTLVFGQLIDTFARADSNQVVTTVSKVALKFVYIGIGAGIGSLLQVSFWMITGERQAARIRGLYLKNIMRQDIAFFDKETSSGEVIGRMSGDTILIQDAMGEKVGKFIQLVSTFFGGFIIAFVKGWLLSLVMLSCFPPIVFAGAAMAIIISKMASRGQIAYAEAGNVVEQTIGSMRTVVSFGGEKRAIEKYNKSLKIAYNSSVKEGMAMGLGVGLVLFVFFASYALAVWYGAKLIIQKGYTGGTVINIIIAIMTGGMSLGQASPSLSAIAAGRAAAYKMFETIERKPEIDAYDTNGMVLKDIKGDIELKNVHFSYPARPDVQIFSGFSLFVPCGTTTALVGESGSGKSTVISLLERFYDPQSGEVLIDGVNLKDLRLSWIREKTGLVSQEPILFMTSIKENIAYGKPSATQEEIRTAMELANAAKFIDKLPQGLDTMVGEHGTQLSGGQKQRIAIARAILKDPKILLLDEATSALDVESERIVQEALLRLMQNRTTVVVAHRLSTVRNADAIAVLRRGIIVEQGPHDELVKDPEGAFSQLIRLQEVHASNIPSDDLGNKDPDEIRGSFDTGVYKSSSQRISSFRRSISKNSSHGGSSRHSFSVALGGLPGPVSIPDSDMVESDVKGKAVDEHDNKHYKNVSLTRLAYMNKPEIPVLIVGSVAAAVHGVIFPIFGLLISNAIKIFFEPPHELRKHSKSWALIFFGLGVVSLFALPIQKYLFGVAGGKLVKRIRAMSFERIVYQEIAWFDEPNNSSGTIGGRLSADAAAVRSLVGDVLSLVAQNIATITAGLLISFIANWRLSLIILAILPLIGLQGYAQIKFLTGFSADAKTVYEEASQVASDAVTSIRTVASFCAEQKVMVLYKEKCKAPLKYGVRQGVVSGLGFGFSNLVLFCSYAISFYAGARLIKDGKAEFSEVFKVFFALTMTAIGISQASAMGPEFTKVKASAASVFDILDRKSKIDASTTDGSTLATIRGDLELRHVSFKYPTRPDVQIFKDLCLSMLSGKTIALVGESGSGKSTVISLLQRYYDPDSGQILLDGVELQKFELKWLRQQMGLVSQEPVLFNETIRANIAYGIQGETSEDEIVKAAKAANAHNFISSLPQGYDTNVGERGVQLSGGQKQRVAIARAILRNPKILLLDEATSALDAESEHLVQEALDNVMVNRTTVVVAHRLSTIKGADMIAVVKNGVVAEKGRHDSLMKIEDGVYASLVALHKSSAT